MREGVVSVMRLEQGGLPVSPERGGSVAASYLAPDLKIHGSLVSTGTVIIDGALRGDIQAQTVMVGRQGRVRATVEALNATVSGAMVGLIKTRQALFTDSARFDGEVQYEALGVQPSADLRATLVPMLVSPVNVPAPVVEQEPPPVARTDRAADSDVAAPQSASSSGWSSGMMLAGAVLAVLAGLPLAYLMHGDGVVSAPETSAGRAGDAAALPATGNVSPATAGPGSGTTAATSSTSSSSVSSSSPPGSPSASSPSANASAGVPRAVVSQVNGTNTGATTAVAPVAAPPAEAIVRPVSRPAAPVPPAAGKGKAEGGDAQTSPAVQAAPAQVSPPAQSATAAATAQSPGSAASPGSGTVDAAASQPAGTEAAKAARATSRPPAAREDHEPSSASASATGAGNSKQESSASSSRKKSQVSGEESCSWVLQCDGPGDSRCVSVRQCN